MTVRPGRDETVDRATLCLVLRGPWATAFERAPEAQRLLADEIARAIPGIMRSLKNYDDYDREYTAVVYPVKLYKGNRR